MRGIWTLVLVGVLVGAIGSLAQQPVTAKALAPVPAKAIALVKVGALDDALVTRVENFVKSDLGIPVHVLAPQESADESLDQIGARVAKLMGPQDVACVAIVLPKTENKAHGVFLPENKVSVLNAGALKPANGDAEVFGRRLEKETMQSIGMLLGLQVCPNPECAMSSYSGDNGLDAKGRNYCPPCRDKFMKAAAAKGLSFKTTP